MLRPFLAAAALLLVAPACQCQPEAFALPDGGFWNRTGLSQKHLASCDDAACGDGTAAPVGGDHCPVPLACRVYPTEQPRCAWLHNLEHGHAVLLYNCPKGCAADVAALQAHFDAQLPHRIVLTPSTQIPKRIAALVWGHGWLGDAYDADAVRTLLDLQDQGAPEAGLSCSP